MTDVKYWVWLSLRVQPGSKTGDQLLLAFHHDAKEIYDADGDAYRDVDGLDEKVIIELLDKNMTESDEIIQYCVVNNIGILTYDSPSYPSRLRRIERAPIILYYRGKLIDFDDNVEIAVVGTRKYSDYGRREAYRISRDMAIGGAIIVSGMARGIDSFCHRAALDVGAHTIAVLGCGINKVYPPEHDELMEEIIEHGTVFSEFRPFTDPIGSNFPIRNRIISGLSLGTLVIEADQRSGALITAKYALKQGRDIFSLPGKVGDANSQGTNELIQKGAKMVQSAEDILGEYEFIFPHRIAINKLPRFSRFKLSYLKKKNNDTISKEKIDIPNVVDKKEKQNDKKKKLTQPATEPQKDTATEAVETQESVEYLDDFSAFNLTKAQTDMVLAMPKGGAVTPDELSGDELPISRVMSMLTILEIKGIVRKLPGNKFERLK